MINNPLTFLATHTNSICYLSSKNRFKAWGLKISDMQIRFGMANSLVTYFEAKTLPIPHEVLTFDMLKILSDLLIKYIKFFSYFLVIL